MLLLKVLPKLLNERRKWLDKRSENAAEASEQVRNVYILDRQIEYVLDHSHKEVPDNPEFA